MALPRAAAQSPAEPSGPVIRVTVDLVQIDAVVTDSKGRHVPGLEARDFEVLEDGQPQTITHFSYVPASGVEAPPVPGELPAAMAMEPLLPAAPLRPEQVRRTMVLMADDLGLTPADIPDVRKAMRRFVDEQMRPGDLVSVMTTSGGMGAMAQLTNDKRQLYAAIERIHYFVGSRPGWTWYTPIEQPTADRLYQKQIKERLDVARLPLLSVGTFSALAYAIEGLRQMPGRKAIAFFSDGIGQSAGGMVQLANRSSVTIYTLDPRGFVSFDATALDAGTAAGGLRAASAREVPYRASQAGLDQLARGTGGIFFHDDNDLVHGLANALDDMRSYYLIGYQPDRNDFEKVRGRTQFHKIQVKVLRAGLQVRSRNGFVGTPDPPASEPRFPQSARQALFSPFQENGFPVHLSAFYSPAAHKNPKNGRPLALVRAMMAIDGHGLLLPDAPDAKKQLNLEIAAAAFSAANEVVTSSDRIFRTAMTAGEMEQTVASGLLYGLDVEVPKPGPYQFRVAVRDANSGRIGSATLFVEIPDFARPGIALSSVRLSDSDPVRNAALTREGVLGAGSAVTRVFASGAVLRYDCTVIGAVIGRQTGKPDVDLAVRLFFGPEPILTGRPIPLAMPQGALPGAIPAAGTIKLPPDLPPGHYAVELVATDHLQGPKPGPAVEWTDFTLVK
jgi:VWFA-related protein